MQKGELCVLTCKPEYAYGASGAPPTIPANATLQFEVELLSWQSTKDILGDGGIIKTVVQEGSGFEQPKGKDEVLLKFKIYNKQKELVDSSADAGAEFTVEDGHCIPALAKCVTHMKRGETSKLVIEPQYGYGNEESTSSSGVKIPAGSQLRAELTLVSWKAVKTLAGTTISMKTLVEVDGYEKPNEGARVNVNYKARVAGEEKVFEEKNNLEFETDDRQVIEGLDKVVMEMKKGEKALATIPPEHGFGSKGLEGKVPSGATLTYEIELVDFKSAKESYDMDAKEMMEAALKYKGKGNEAFKLGDFPYAHKKYEKAVKFLEFDQKYTEDEKREAKKVKMACWNNEAQCGLKTKDYVMAKKSCDKVLNIDSQNIKALYRRAQSYIATKDYLEASTDLKNAITIDPTCKEAKIEMKRLLKLQAEYNSKQKKLYSGMFEKMSKMEATEMKRKGIENPVLQKEETKACTAGCCGEKEPETVKQEEEKCTTGCCG